MTRAPTRVGAPRARTRGAPGLPTRDGAAGRVGGAGRTGRGWSADRQARPPLSWLGRAKSRSLLIGILGLPLAAGTRQMTQPRCIEPGMTVMVTRRTLRRTQLLRPDAAVRQLYVYCLATTAARHGIRVHAVTIMSTHEHLIVTDTKGRLPLFLQELHRLVALGIKVLRKWEGAIWDHERPSVVRLRTPQAVLEKLAYVMGNPVAAGLVRYAKDWPGLRTLPRDLGRVRLTARRPSCYFDAHNATWPTEAVLSLALPDLDGMSGDRVRQTVEALLRELEHRARHDVQANGWNVLGSDRCAKASPFRRARGWEPLRGRNPSFAVGRGQREAFFEAVAAARAFRIAYRQALERWRSGWREAVFPRGTWLMSRAHGALVAA